MGKVVHGGNVEEISRTYKINVEDIIDFSANINPVGLNNNVKSAMINALDKVEKYPDIYYLNLKESISKFADVDIENLVIGNGAAEVIFNIIRGLKPKKVLLPAPTFSEYEEATLSIDGDIEYYHLREDEDFNLNMGLIDCLNKSIDMIFICNPNNPTGVLTKNTFIENLAQKCIETKTTIVIDESFLDFLISDKEYTAKSLLEKYKNIIIVKSLTKFFAMPGIRIGYGICCNDTFINLINKVTVPWTVNIVAADGIVQALKENDYMKYSINYVENEKKYLYNNLKKIENIKVFKPSVNFIMFKVLNNINLKEKMLRYNILIRSCSNYEGLNSSFYRVAVRTREENEILINSLKDCKINS